MTREIRGEDFSGARFTDVSFEGARFRYVNLKGVKIVEAMMVDADLNGYVGNLKVNGVEVWPLIAAEMERRYPERARLFQDTPEGMREGWSIVEQQWNATIERARNLPEPTLHERVDEEWSFLETMRHVIMVVDSWFSRVVLGRSGHWYRYGVFPSFIPDASHLGVEDGDPDLDEVEPVFRERFAAVREYVDALTPEELVRTCSTNEARGYPPETDHQVIACLWTILEELWAHNRFANRDLDTLEG